MKNTEDVLAKLNVPWNFRPEHRFWAETLDSDIEQGCITVSKFCSILRHGIGNKEMPVDIENALIDLVRYRNYAVSSVCQWASKYATQVWLNNFSKEPAVYKDLHEYTMAQLKEKFLIQGENKNAEV